MDYRTFLFGVPCALALFAGCVSSTVPADSVQTASPAPTRVSGTVLLETDVLNAAPGEAVVTGGWADMGSLVYATGRVKTIDDKSYPDPLQKRKAFTDAIAKSSPTFVLLSGDIDLSDGAVSDRDHSYFDAFKANGAREHEDFNYTVGSNTTIIGLDGARIKYGGLLLKDAKNVIIRNVTFYDGHGSTEIDTKVKPNSKASADTMNIYGESENIWIDHCTFTDGVCVDLKRNYNHDGSLDIKQGKNITVSFCEFTNHDKVMLICPNDSYTTPENCQITLHHNYFHGTVQRMPRSRGTQMHIYNNVFDNIGVADNGGYSLGPGIASQFIVENNYFGAHKSSIVKYFDSSADKNALTFSRLYHAGNEPELSADSCSFDSVEKVKSFAAHETAELPWSIPYATSPEDASAIKSTVPKYAGAGKPVMVTLP